MSAIFWPCDAIYGNIGSGNGLVPDGTKPLPGPVPPETSFTGSAEDVNSWYEFEKYPYKITSNHPRGQFELTVVMKTHILLCETLF